MKKTLSLLVCTICALNVYAQKSVLLKMRYKPLHSYVSTMSMNMDMEMDMKGDSVTMEKIKSSGQKFPMLMQMNQSIASTMNVGAQKNSILPLEIKYDKMDVEVTMNGNKIPSPPNQFTNQKMLGKIINDKFQIDSIPDGEMNTEQKEALTAMVNMMINQVKFPEKPLKIGDSFTQNVPMKLPVAGNNFEMEIKVIYKLTAINNDIAYFNLQQSLLADMNTTENMLMHMEGNGDGKMEYDIKNSFYKNVKSNINLTYDMDIKNMKILGKSKIISNNNVVITPAN